MSLSDEAALLRRRVDALEAAVAAMGRKGGSDCTSLVLEVQAAPATALEFVSVKAVVLDGEEEEGAAVSLAAAGTAFPAANVGTKKPPDGTYLLGRLVGGLWVVQYDGEEA